VVGGKCVTGNSEMHAKTHELGVRPPSPVDTRPEALAAFVHANRAPIRARFRAGLNPTLRHMVETGDILSTVFRRTQGYLQKSDLRHDSPGGLWRLIEIITNRAAADHARMRSATRRAELAWRDQQVVSGKDGPSTRQSGVPRPETDLLSSIPDPIDRQIARLRAQGLTHSQIATSLGLTDAQARQRWARLCRAMSDQTEPGGPS
jgi:hypothetical protein